MDSRLEGNTLILDLENDQKARDMAFSYSMNILPTRVELADEILSVIEKVENKIKEAKNDLHGTRSAINRAIIKGEGS